MTTERAIPLPLSPHHWATLTACVPFTAAEWRQLLVILEAMRPALVDEIPPNGGAGEVGE